jgi:hypothetical protein
MKRSNRSTTDGDQARNAHTVSFKQGIASIPRDGYVVIATHHVVKRARLGGKEHSKARCRVISVHRSLAGPSTGQPACVSVQGQANH